MRALFWQVGGREIDGNAASGKGQARGDQGGANPLFRFGNSLVRQADNVEGGQTGRDLDLNVHGAGLDALKRHGGDALDHVTQPLNDHPSLAGGPMACKNI